MLTKFYTICITIITILLIGLTLPLLADTTNNEVLVIDQARLSYSNAESPPSFTDSPTIKLPHQWNKKGFYGYAWYQLTTNQIDIENTQTWSVYLPKVDMNAEVWINNILIGSGGSMTPPLTRYWHSPLFFTIPSTLLNPAGKKINIIHIRVAGFSNNYASLGKVLIGPSKILRPIYKTNKFNSVTVRIIGSSLILVLALMLFPIWIKRNNSMYFWYMLACFMWIGGSANTYVSDIPVPEIVWEKLIHIILGWVAICISFFIIRLTDNRFPRLEKLLLSLMFLLNVIIVFLPLDVFFSLIIYYMLFTLIVGITSLIWLFIVWWKEPHPSYTIVLISVSIIALSGLHDLAIQAHLFNIQGRFWLDLSIPLVLLVMGYLTVTRFLDAIQESETLNIELESRVEKAHSKIEQNYQHIITLETSQAAIKERDRIYRNLHDDLGVKLLSLVYRSKTDEMTTLARSALNDLREMVSHKPTIKINLLREIKEWKKECLLRGSESNKKLHFKRINIPNKLKMINDKSDHLHRLLTEAVTNAIKHNKGKHIFVTLRYRSNCLKVTVKSDHNDPLNPLDNNQLWEEGSGLKNMRYRIQQLNGRINWKDSNLFNEVSWIIPLDQ